MCYYTYINVNEALNKTRRIYGKKTESCIIRSVCIPRSKFILKYM